MIINKFNIEKWMFDYFEDNLTMHEKIEFERFLESNPQFEGELQFWEDSYSSSTEYPSYEVPETLIKGSIVPKRNVLLVIGMFFILTSSIGIYILFNSLQNTEESLNLIASEIGEVESRFSEDIVIDLDQVKGLKKQKSTTESFNSNNVAASYKSNKEGVNAIRKSNSRFKKSIDPFIEKQDYIIESDIKNVVSIEALTKVDGEELNRDQNIGELFNRLNISSNEMLAIVVPGLNKEVVAFSSEKVKNNSKYNYLEFKRSKKNRKRKGLNLKDNKSKERDKNIFDNFALIGSVFYNKNNKSKKIKRSKFLDKIKNKELALTNAHDPIFIKINSNPIENNLALVGGLEMTRVKTNLSNRWRGAANEQNRGLISVDTYLKKLNAGVGINAFSSQMNNNNLTTSSLGLTYSQRIQLKENTSINIGLKYDYNLTKNKNITSDNVVPLEFKQNKLMSFSNNFNHNMKTVSHNLSTAVWYDGQFLYGGINIDNIKTLKTQNNNANEFAEYINPFKFAIQLGTDYRRNVYSALIISPQLNYNYELNKSDLWLGSSLKYKRFVTGVGVSLSNAYKVNIGVQGDKVRLIYAFDVSKSKAESQFYGTHEVSFRYLLRGNNNWN